MLQAYAGDLAVGTIVCKQEVHRGKLDRGYLAMLSTREAYRGQGVGTSSSPYPVAAFGQSTADVCPL